MNVHSHSYEYLNSTETRNMRFEALKYECPRPRLQISKRELIRSSQGQRSGDIFKFARSENSSKSNIWNA